MTFTLALVVALGLASPSDSPKEDVPAGIELLKRGDDLADEGKTTDAEVRYQEAMERLLPGIRKLPFKHPVKRDVTPREEIRDVLIEEMNEDTPPAQFRAEELAMKAFGLLPMDLDFKELMLKAYTEEIGAFYDPRTDTMHLILEKGGGRQPSFVEALLGRKPGFSKDETKTVIAHELTHALADQHYDLDKLQKANSDDDDRQLALSALIEGEATLVMMGAQLQDWKGDETAALPADGLGATFNFLMPMMKFAGGPALRSAPPILGDSMLFPYLRGLVFCAQLTNEGGWKALDDAYRNPPLSTEQILHPEKYKGQPDTPQALDLGELDPGDGWKELTRNVLGEFQIGVLLRRFDGREAAAGWDGDQFAAFEGPDGRLGLVWATTWDSEEEARQFARAVGRYQASRHGFRADEDGTGIREVDGKAYAVERRGTDVAVVEGFGMKTTEGLVQMALGSEKTEKLRPTPRAGREN